MKQDTIIQNRKVVVVGDGETGKTSMLYVFSRNLFPEIHIPTILETEVVRVTPAARPGQIEPPPIDLTVWDTAGQEDYDRLRPMSYNHTDVFLVCYSVDNHHSYLNVAEKWVPELKHFSPDAAILLVGTKTDLRFDKATHQALAENKLAPITSMQGQALSQRVQALAYLECSCEDKDSIYNVFKAAATVAFYNQNSRKKHKQCVVL